MIQLPVQRWYAGFFFEGRPDDKVETMAALVRKYDLAKYIPVVRCERRERGRKKVGSFYLFVGLESTERGKLPDPVKAVFDSVGFTSRYVDAFSLEEIKGMVGQEMSVHDYARHIPYWRRPRPDDDVFAQPLSKEAAPTDHVIELTEQHDAFMRWLSSVACGSWDGFEATYRSLNLHVNGVPARSLARRLRLLGHLETSSDGVKWSAAPPVLVRTDLGEERQTYILCGQRDAHLLASLERADRFEMVPQDGLAPAVVRIEVEAIETLLMHIPFRTGIPRLHVEDDVALSLARALPDIGGWLDSCESLGGIKPHMFTVKRFDGGTFVDKSFSGASGFYELWNPDEEERSGTRPKYTLYYNAPTERWLRADWYGLRYVALCEDGEPCPVHYDPGSDTVAIQQAFRWPEVYERVLVLSSGFLPAQEGNWLRYKNISLPTLEALQDKLNLQLIKEAVYA